MIELVGIVLFVVVLSSNRSLSNRINALEQKLKSVSLGAVSLPGQPIAQPGTTQTVVHGGMEEYIGPPVAVPTGNVIPAEPKEPDASDRFSAWLKDDWLMKLGALIFIIGCGWFVSYAFANNWIGPVGRISIGVIAGALVMAFGFWRMLRFPQQGGIFLALGAGMAILSIFAGRQIYGFFTPASAITFDFIICAFVALASYKFKLRPLALTAEILAYVAPLLVDGSSDSVFIFSYLLAVSIATLVLAGLMGWRALIAWSLVFVGLYSLPYIASPYSPDAPVILNFAYIFAMLYLLSGMFAVVKQGVQEARYEIVLAVVNGALLFLWIYNVPAKEWQALLFAVWAIVFAVGSFIAFRASSKPDPFYAYGSVAVAFIAAATAVQLDGASLTIALTVEVCLLVVTVLALTKDMKTATATSMLFAAPVLLSFASMSKYLMSRDLFTEDTFVLLALAFALIVTGRVLSPEKKDESGPGSALIVFGTMYIWFVIWCFLHILMPTSPDIATFSALTVYTVVGLWAYFVGLSSGDKARRVYGAALLVFVVARLLVVDVWSMELSGRVITFFVIGALLMSTAFLTKRKSAIAPTV